MKHTKILIAVIATFIITLLLINTAVWWLQDTWSFKKCFLHGATLGIGLIFGWIPSVFVGYDLNDKFNSPL
jgi:hypothetical protein